MDYINEYNSEAAYAADMRPTDGSSVSTVGSSIKYDGRNIETKTPSFGDAVYKDSNRKVHFVKAGTLDTSLIPATWEKVGGCGIRWGRDIMILYWDNQTKKYADVFRWYLTGTILTDGVSHTVDFTANSVSQSVTWQTSTLADFATALNNAIKDIDFDGHSYSCYTEGTGDDMKVILQHDTYTAWKEPSMSGVTFNRYIATENPADSSAYKNNGVGSESGIYSMSRAIAYFSSDINNTTYNPTTTVSADTTYPVCLPGYLGTSAYSGGDKCAWLRAKYGEGREGWLNYLESMRVKLPNTRGAMSDTMSDGKTLTYNLVGKKYTRASDSSQQPLYPGPEYCAGIGFDADGLEQGNWFMLSLAQLSALKDEITLGGLGVSRATADALNRTLLAMGGTQISNASYFWSSSRYSTVGEWYCGYIGNVSGYGFYYARQCLPALLYRIED